MNQYTVGIFRVTDPSFLKQETSSLPERYIALLPATPDRPEAYFVSETLFGLRDQMTRVSILKWHIVEKEMQTSNFYKLPSNPSDEEKEMWQ